jgi:MarR family transcriptional regulator, organic hydroperoxide resistance regulator
VNKSTENKAQLLIRAVELEGSLGRYLHEHEDPDPWLSLNLTIAQLKSLFFIKFEGTSSSKQLASALGVTPPNVTGIIDRMIEHGLVSREYNQQNRRMQLLKLTQKGDDLINELKVRQTAHFSHLLEMLNVEDLKALIQAMTALVSAAEKSQSSQSSPNTLQE